MLSDSISKILNSARCVDLGEITAEIFSTSSSRLITNDSNDSVEMALLSLPQFARCAVAVNSWCIAGSCEHAALRDLASIGHGTPKMPLAFDWQLNALRAWESNGRRGMIEAVTGSGKTVLAMLAIEQILADKGSIMVIVPTLELQTQWFVQLTYVFGEKCYVDRYGGFRDRYFSEPRIVVAVVNSVRNFSFARSGHGDLLVADEVHRYAAFANSNALDCGFDYRLGLSATIERPDGAHIRYLLPYFGSTVYTYSHSDARCDGVIAPFSLTLGAVTMYANERDEYEEVTDEIRRLIRKFQKKYNRPIPPEQFVQILIDACKGRLFAISPDLEEIGRHLQAALLSRRAKLDKLNSKIDYLGIFISDIKNSRRCLVFTQSIESAEMAEAYLLQRGLKAAAIHSKTGMQLRREQLDRFKSGRIDVLVAPRILDEGVDVPEADLAIILTASGSQRQLIQRLGRILRKKPQGEGAHLVVFFASDTIEDPENGAHETLLPALITAAESVQILR